VSKDLGRKSSLCEKPITQHPRRLSHWLNIGQEKKIHSLIDKVYSKKNLEKAWETVRKNGGAQGADKVTIGVFKENLEANLSQIHEELRVGEYKTHPLRRVYIPKAGKKDQLRPLSIPSVRDRIVQQALTQRLTPVFERDFDNSSFGYRPGRSPHDALCKVWREINAGSVWIVDADLRDFFGSVEHEKLMQLVARWVSDGRVLRLIEQMLRTPVVERNKILPTPKGTPQGGLCKA